MVPLFVVPSSFTICRSLLVCGWCTNCLLFPPHLQFVVPFSCGWCTNGAMVCCSLLIYNLSFSSRLRLMHKWCHCLLFPPHLQFVVLFSFAADAQMVPLFVVPSSFTICRSLLVCGWCTNGAMVCCSLLIYNLLFPSRLRLMHKWCHCLLFPPHLQFVVPFSFAADAQMVPWFVVPSSFTICC